MRPLLPLLLLVAACGGAPASSSVTPSPVPVPTPVPPPVPAPTPAPRFTYAGRVVSTQLGTPIPGATVALDTATPVQADAAGLFSADATASTLHAVISAPGYLTRDTRLSAGHPIAADLIATAAPFSSIFYGQLVRNRLESPTPDIVRVLPAAPSIYLQTTGLSGRNIDHLVTAIQTIVPALTGQRFTVATVDTGTDLRPDREGWIVVEIVTEPNSGHCGRAYVGQSAGHVWLNMDPPHCAVDADAIHPLSIQHELCHALGFWHIDVPFSLMNGTRWTAKTTLTDGERYHAMVAYHRSAGNRDPDNDSPAAAPLAVRERVIVVD